MKENKDKSASDLIYKYYLLYLEEKSKLDKLKEYINSLYDDEYISYGTKEEMLSIVRGEDNE